MKKHYFQLDPEGVLKIAFVGTENELREQIKEDWTKEIQNIQKFIDEKEVEIKTLDDKVRSFLGGAEKYKALARISLAKAAIEEAIAHRAKIKTPDIGDHSFFVLEPVGKDVEMRSEGAQNEAPTVGK